MDREIYNNSLKTFIRFLFLYYFSIVTSLLRLSAAVSNFLGEKLKSFRTNNALLFQQSRIEQLKKGNYIDNTAQTVSHDFVTFFFLFLWPFSRSSPNVIFIEIIQRVCSYYIVDWRMNKCKSDVIISFSSLAFWWAADVWGIWSPWLPSPAKRSSAKQVAYSRL